MHLKDAKAGGLGDISHKTSSPSLVIRAYCLSYFISVFHKTFDITEIIKKDPNVAGFTSSIGVGGPNLSGNTGRIMIRLKPRSERKINADEVIQQLRPNLQGHPGIQVFLQNPPTVRIGGTLTKSLYQLSLLCTDTEALYKGAIDLEERLKKLPELQDVTSDLQIKSPYIKVVIDRDKIAQAGVTAHQIEDALYSAYSSRQISTIYSHYNQHMVILELEPQYQSDPSVLSMLYVRSSNGNLVPLYSVAEINKRHWSTFYKPFRPATFGYTIF